MTGERRKYSPRKQKRKSPRIIKKVISKALDRDHIWSLRAIGITAKISHCTAHRILKDAGIKYSTCNNKIKLTLLRKLKRVEFARKMRKRSADWTRTFITDECSFWLNKSRPQKLWTANRFEEEGKGVHGVKVHC